MKKFIILANVVGVIIFGSTYLSAQIYWNQNALFSGSSTSYMSVPNSSSLDITGSITIEAWINPGSLSGGSKGIISKGGALGTSLRYGIRLINAGRIGFYTNGANRITSSSSSVLQVGKWTHVACSFSSVSDSFKIYINGVLDTAAIIVGAEPQTNPDSVFIGISGNSTPFAGRLDEVRIWNKEVSAEQISKNMRSSLGTSSGIYLGLVLSSAFQREFPSALSARDLSDFGNHGQFRNVSSSPAPESDAAMLPFSPDQNLTLNNCIFFNGDDTYLAGTDTPSLNPVNAVTLECWFYPIENNQGRIITKGNSYAFIYTSGSINALINGALITSGHSIPLKKWSHIAFTYTSTGQYKFVFNGVQVTAGFNNLGPVTVNSDSLFIGGGLGTILDIDGYIDELRITNKSKTISEIQNSIYASFNKSSDPNILDNNVNYGFDGNTFDNNDNGGPKLLFRNNTTFSNPGTVESQPVSPVNQDNINIFHRGYYIQQTRKLIPQSGTLRDSQTVNKSVNLQDINLFVSLNHTKLSDLEISLISPHGDSIVVFNNRSTNCSDNNLITIFDDDADSSLSSNSFSSFHAKIKPENNLGNVLMNKNIQGSWKLVIRDEVSLDSGFLYAWGLNFNEEGLRGYDLQVYSLIQGFYDPAANLQQPDTITAILRNSSFPYTAVQSVKTILKTDGEGLFNFTPATAIQNGISFILELSHRNSINTISTGMTFNFNDLKLNIRDSGTLVVGSNVIQVDTSPVRFAIYGGDVNKDGIVDVTDALIVDNNSFNFATGYLASDVTGDNFTDASDASIVENNAADFVSVIFP